MTSGILSNHRIALRFSDSALLEITDLCADRHYPVRSTAYELVTDRATLRGPLILTHISDTAATLQEVRDGFCVTVTYRLCGETAFFEKEIRLEAAGDFTVERVLCEALTLDTPPDRIHLHDDQSLWHCPINYFLESDGGGLALGLAYPYWDTALTDGGVSLGYTLHYRATDALTLEPVFCGVYQHEGIERYSHGPYPGQRPMPHFPGFPEESGLRQHFPDHIIPEDAGIPPERLDWGAVWAMQSYMKYRLPRLPLPEPGYFLWQNGWWAGLSAPDPEAVDVLLNSGVHDMMTAPIAFGHDRHPNTEPRYLRDVALSPLRFPVYSGEEPADMAPPQALHSAVASAPAGEIVGYTEEFHPPRAWEDFIHTAHARGMHIGSFSMPNIAYAAAPQWFSTDECGRPHEYFHTRLSCPACDEFMALHFEVTCRMLDSIPGRFWAFDGRWQDYCELGGYHFGRIGPSRCHSAAHGHPPGDNRYKEFRNIQAFKRRLRLRYPTLCLEQYYGLKRGSVWMLDDLNADENYYETTGPEDNRLQAWHNENSRFRPHYLNYTAILGEDYESFCSGVISALASASYAQLARGYRALRDDERCRSFLRRWRAWADEHIDYLTDRRCLFDCYGFTPLDGSAHIRGDRGFLFLFNAAAEPAVARIPLNRWIGLEAAPDTRFSLAQLYPAEVPVGTAALGEEMLIELPPHATTLYALTPTDAHTPLPRPDPALPTVDAFRLSPTHRKESHV